MIIEIRKWNVLKPEGYRKLIIPIDKFSLCFQVSITSSVSCYKKYQPFGFCIASEN